MNIFVCVKQVPATTRVEVDEETGVLKRGGVQSKMNPYDLYALEAALRLRETCGGHVCVGTMGPPQAEAVIREAYHMGADAGYVFSDRRFGGADVLATGYTLSQAIRSIGEFDLILCGRQTTDGDTAQVGPSLAERLGIPHAAWVSRIDVADGGVLAEQQLQDGVETVFLPFPCLLTVEKDIYTPRLPSLLRARSTRERPVAILGLDGLQDRNASHYGLSGSATRVERVFAPDGEQARETLSGSGLGKRIHAHLRARKFV